MSDTARQTALPIDEPVPQVISASRRSDIPAFHHRWLMRRLEEGACDVRNPFGGGIRRVDLRPGAVLAIALWTRDPSPMVVPLRQLAKEGYRFYVQVTLNGYPSFLEPGNPPLARVLDTLRCIRSDHGDHTVVWRYDPVILTTATPPAYHLERVATLAAELVGTTDTCVISLVDLYRKTERNLLPALAAAGESLLPEDPARDGELLLGMAAALEARGIQPALCCEAERTGPRLPVARCLDDRRIERILGRPVRLPARPTRKGCGCRASVDIGAYDTCPRGCVYCYATNSAESGKRGAAQVHAENLQMKG